jgi:ketosteroid isomerase-like protein
MSNENVEILRRALEAFNRGDAEAWIATWHPEGELYELVGIPDAPDVYRGHEGVRRWLANARSIVGHDFQMKPADLTTVGDVVMAEVEGRGVGEGSGVPVEWKTYIAIWMREGKIVRSRAFFRRAEALDAARLSE